MTVIVTVANQKGGVGKTATVVNLGHALALRRKETLIVDFDPQGQSSTSLGIKPTPGVFHMLSASIDSNSNPAAIAAGYVQFTGRQNLYILPGNLLTNTAQTVLNASRAPVSVIRRSLAGFIKRGRPHFILLDTAPSAGGIQERAIWAADWVIIPTTPDSSSLESVRSTMNLLKELKEKEHWRGKVLGILPTIYEERTRESKASMDDLKSVFSSILLPPISQRTVVRDARSRGVTIFEYDAKSVVAEEYDKLARILIRNAQSVNETL